jgi:drug/metabolite transporter (DMT)-like permease
MDVTKSKLRTVAGAFAIGAVAILVVLSLVDLGEPESPDLADAAALTAAIFGTVGLLMALRWWSTAGERASDPGRLQIGFIVRMAVAETGLLLGVLGFTMTGSMTAPMVGGVLFLAALLLLVAGLGRVAQI